ncbi:MAG: hypothetical protein JRI23_03480 [Deltaproteobacteria bacterium]|jgi:hypothetical protein|nr:hypothetical protein [Deltaproteobacteria bacterium]MBW2530577.1 hypothetical protein [Deltaproteobacteria bacterium]
MSASTSCTGCAIAAFLSLAGCHDPEPQAGQTTSPQPTSATASASTAAATSTKVPVAKAQPSVEVTFAMVRDDLKNLGCALDGSASAYRCAYSLEGEPAPSAPSPRDDAKVLQPLTMETATPEPPAIYLAAGFWAEPAVKGWYDSAGADAGSERLYWLCSFRAEGTVAAKIRWKPEASWREGKYPYGKLTGCTPVDDAPKCRRSALCHRYGSCAHDGTKCVAKTDDDCRSSVACKQRSACSAQGGTCVRSPSR